MTTGLLALVAGLALATCGDDPKTCERSSDCSATTACFEGVCQSVLCRTNLDCPPDAICFADNGEQGNCGPQECRTDDDCEDQRTDLPFCVGGRCAEDEPPECAVRSECANAQTCVEGACVEVEVGAACAANDDCGNPEVCDPARGDSGECVAACVSNPDCAELEGLNACNSASGLCFGVECLSGDDCQAGEVCGPDFACAFERFPCDELICDDFSRPFETEPLNGMCRCVACLSDNNCIQTAQEVCLEGGPCECNEVNRCVDCSVTGVDEAACPVSRPFFRDGCCLECLSDSDCRTVGIGSACQAGSCVLCNCQAGCECPEGADCLDEGDGVGRCRLPLGQVGDPCFAQDECETNLACNYSTGECVAQGAGGLCLTGCPPPSRCAAVPGGAFCYGCDPEGSDCPVGTTCQVGPGWEGVFDGGRCLN